MPATSSEIPPLHNAYMSLGPIPNPKSSKYDERFVNLLCRSEEEAKEIVRVLVEAGVGEEALGLEYVLWGCTRVQDV
jgi:hypothetical protein